MTQSVQFQEETRAITTYYYLFFLKLCISLHLAKVLEKFTTLFIHTSVLFHKCNHLFGCDVIAHCLRDSLISR